MLPNDHDERLKRAQLALEGLSVGDAFGECFFNPTVLLRSLTAHRALPAPPWHYTDDTEMALAIVEVLQARGHIDQEQLASAFARRYAKDPRRGYGGTAHEILRAIGEGVPWQLAAGRAFSGMGSMGNGGAMRVAPLGAYFAGDMTMVVAQAQASAAVTHAHPDGQAGTIAVAVAAAGACVLPQHPDLGWQLLDLAIHHTPEGPTRQGLYKARSLPRGCSVELAVSALGSGSDVLSGDTVPFALWCVAQHPADYEEALWLTVSGLGDRDTTCAIVGSIVALVKGRSGLPAGWLAAREPLTWG
jgi:ADP-ribosylglycohydrolase